jgi:predicted dithiol-disulfide oxidoreductase (DUF899 family)
VFLKEEKEFTWLRDKINAQRRDLPLVRVQQNYGFQGPKGSQTLADLFEGRPLVPVSQRAEVGSSPTLISM